MPFAKPTSQLLGKIYIKTIKSAYYILTRAVFGFICIGLLLFIKDGHCSGPLTIRVGAYENHPKIYTNADGIVVGIFPDILDTIAFEEHWQLEYVFGSWTQCLERLAANQIDIMVDVAYSDNRNRLYDFSSETVFLNWGTLYTRPGYEMNSLLDLQGRTIAVMKGSIHTEGEDGIKSLVSKFDLEPAFIEVDNYQQVFEHVDAGTADAGVVNRLYGALNDKRYHVLKTPFLFNPVQLKFAFPKDNPESRLIREKVDAHLKSLKIDFDSVFYEIIGSYLNGIEFQRRYKGQMRVAALTPAEKTWLRNHPTIRLGVDPAYGPYSFIDKHGAYQGMAMDFMHLISQQLGIRMAVVPGLNWNQILANARNASLDVVLMVVQTPEREHYLRFSDIYIPTPLVLMSREDNQLIDGPEDMADHKVALVKGYASSEKAMAENPRIKPYWVDSPIAGLTAVSVGEADLYLGVLGINDFLTRKHGISNLKVAARYDMRFGGQCFGIRQDWPELVTILNKTLDAIPEKKKIAIFDAWISAKSAIEGSAALQQQNALTQEETEWIQRHPNIRLGVDPEFAPFEFFSKKGDYSGIASDYVHILNKRLGLNMTVVSALTWQDAMDKARHGELDVLPCVSITQSRRSNFNFSAPYLNFNRVIITRTDTPFLIGLNDIFGMKVAVQASTSHEGYLKEHSQIQPVLYDTLEEALRAVSNGHADAFVGNIASAIYWIRKQHLTNLKVAAPVSNEIQKLHFAIRKDWPEMVTIINKGLASIGLSKENKIQKRWIDVEYTPGMNPALFWKYTTRIGGTITIVLFGILAWNYRLKKEIRYRRKIERNLTYRLDFETFLFDLSALFINLKTTQINDHLNQALEKITGFVCADCGYIFEIKKQATAYDNSHGWFSEQADDIKPLFKQIEMANMPWCAERLNRGEMVIVPSVANLTNEASTEKKRLLSIGIKSFVNIPMTTGGEATGFIGVAATQEERHWSTDEVVLLQAVGRIFTNALQRKQAEEALQQSHEKLEQRIAERTTDLAKANESLQKEIIDRKQMEAEKEQLSEQLIQAQKMEAIGTMAGGIAHDFNNILMPIMGYAEMTQLNLSPGSPNRDYIQQIISASLRAKELIKQILTFSRQAAHDFKPINLKPLIKETLKLMRSSLPSTIEINENIDPIIGDILANPTQIHQLLMNLSTNAYHAMRQSGGTLSVSVNETPHDGDGVPPGVDLGADSYICLRISDTGHGIAPEIQDRILEPYFTTKNPDDGTGLGLSVVHGIVKKHGGHLSFSSAVNKGTTFQILFPKLYDADTHSEEGPKQSIPGGSEHIWVLDDDDIIAQMEKRMLQSLGYTVQAFNRPDGFLTEFKENSDQVDLIITDMTMPNISGTELARQILQIKAGLPIILCSGFSENIDLAKTKAIGIQEYLMKPVVMKELAVVVRKLLTQNP